MAGVEGFEPSTHGLEGRCSIQLRYTPWGRLERTTSRWVGRRVSNPPPPEPQSGALPDELRPPSLALNTESTNSPCGWKVGRGREIRTPDILLPKQARYQTALYPDDSHRSTERPLISGARIILTCRLSVNANYMIGGHFLHPSRLNRSLQKLDYSGPAAVRLLSRQRSLAHLDKPSSPKMALTDALLLGQWRACPNLRSKEKH